MKKWSLLSIPLVGFAGITVWAQAVAGAPTGTEPGVTVTEGAPRHSVQKLDGSTENRRLSPATGPTASPKATSPALKSAPNDATSSPLSTKAAKPAQTAPAPDDPSADSTEESGVEFVEPAQVTSPVSAPTDDSTSSSQLDDKGGLSSNNGRSGSSNG
ncbi:MULTISPECIES: hypothetical protein [Arthrobacter]|uniref:hypothetical protein n=1 Tax=Arthrobacter TaxID=1663 RepID=UPI001BE94FB3|nr:MULTISPECIES: hypothetical protein [Arthrobacter]MBT2547323.1 hypothetical protein [Arthrobacter sp. ISL-65]MDQ0620001.1 putative membrane protein [Arthrobacter globiformis]